MTDPEIEKFRYNLLNSRYQFAWRSVDGDVLPVIGYHPDYKEPWETLGEPVAVCEGGKVVSLHNSEVADFFEMRPVHLERISA